MTPEQLNDIESRTSAAKSVTEDDPLESNLAWCANWQTTAYEVSGRQGNAPYNHALCVAEETAELLVHAPDDITALIAEIRRMQSILLRIDGLASRQVGPEPSGGESKRGWIYAHDIFTVLDELETR